MFLSAPTLDDLLNKVFTRLLKSKQVVKSTRGPNVERCGVLLRLTNPRARLSHSEKKGKAISGLGEFLWYLASSNRLDFIEYYLTAYRDDSHDDRTVHGAYGPRMHDMRGHNQIENIISLLSLKDDTRRAVVQLLNAEDIDIALEAAKFRKRNPGSKRKHKEIPCTCTLQFMIRKTKLHLYVQMRSNDAYLGLPHDVFAFTMLQELVARRLGCGLGHYHHFVGSLHLYEKHKKHVRKYLDEGWQSTKNAMPAMPSKDISHSVTTVLRAERRLRGGPCSLDVGSLKLHDYWADLVRLLQVYSNYRHGAAAKNKAVLKQMKSSIYDAFIVAKQSDAKEPPNSPQMSLPFPEPASQEDSEW